MRHQSGLTECVVSSNGVLAIKKCSGFGQHATYFYDVIWSTEMSVKLRSFGYYVGLSIKCFVKIKFVFWAVVVVKWSACLPSTLTTWVQVPLTPAGFSVKFVLKSLIINKKRSGLSAHLKSQLLFQFTLSCSPTFVSASRLHVSMLLLPSYYRRSSHGLKSRSHSIASASYFTSAHGHSSRFCGTSTSSKRIGFITNTRIQQN